MVKPKDKGKIKGIYMHKKQWELLDKYAENINCPTNWLIRNIIDNWMIRNKKLLKTKA
jgi:predicted DNA-binding ribbon-helix-helix protein